eukprot:4471700-Amphidinium_carterae.1
MSDRMERAQALLEEGMLLKKACSSLVDGHVASMTEEVLQEMRLKHPAAREGEKQRLTDLRKVAPSAAPDFSRDQVSKALQSFAKGSAAGPCGLKPQHLKDAMTPGQMESCLTALHAVMRLLMTGR